jgi:glycosyltransferase involved in cell wall biosynthesis
MATRFSVFIPVWNDARWLPGAIESLLAQTHRDWELIVGDNMSTEDIESIVARYPDERIRYHRWPNHVDYAGNANRTIGLCRYEWLQYLSADDRLLPTCLARMARQVEEASAAGRCLSMVLTGCGRFDEKGRPAEQVYFGSWRLKSLRGGILEPAEWLESVAAPGAPPWNMGSLAISAEVYPLMGGFFREEIGLTVDLEVATRAAAYGPVGYVAEPLLHFTVRGDSMTAGLARRNLERRDLLPPVAAALLSALAVHEHRRAVSPRERRYVMTQVADQLVGRALMQRYVPGGRGRTGAIRDLLRATYHDPRWLLSFRQLARAGTAVFAPGRLIGRLKRQFMERQRYF